MRFEDGKEEGALRTIGEVSKALGIKPHVLRYWERHFPELRPLKRAGGRRYYRARDIELLQRIDRLINREGYTIRGARAALKAQATGEAQAAEPADPAPAGAVGEAAQASHAADGRSGDTHGLNAQDRARLIERLRAIRGQLRQIVEA